MKVWFLDRKKVLDELNGCALDLKRERKEVRRVFLFGSLATGNHSPGSDADVLVMIDQASGRMMDLIPEYLFFFSRVSIPVDIIPVTEENYHQEMRKNNFFYRRIAREGVELGSTDAENEKKSG